MHDGREPRRRPHALGLLALVLLALAAPPTASAHGGDEHGTVTLHDAEDGPDARTLSCTFWVRGTGMSDPDGTLRVAHRLDGPGAHSHRVATWTGTPDGDGTHSFELGPLTIHESDDGSLLTAFVSADLEHAAVGHAVDYRSCDDAPEEPEPPEGPGGRVDADVCAATLVAAARGDGAVRLHAGGLSGDAVLQRASGDGGFRDVARLTPRDHVFVDGDTEAGVTYTYRLVADAQVCAAVEVTAIPVFPAPLAGVLAAALGVTGYGVLRRRA